MSMVEKVARAIYEATPFPNTEGPYEAQTDEYRRMCKVLARAAIEALREPTEEMANEGMNAGTDADDPYEPGNMSSATIPIWQAMLDAALKEADE